MQRMRGRDVTAGVAEMHGWRESMEDEHIALHFESLGSVFAVCDGHAGNMCSKFVIDTLRKEARLLLLNVMGAKDVSKIMCDFFIATDKSFLEQKSSDDKSGTTCVLVIVETASSRATIAHVGDSRVACGHLQTCEIIDYGGSEGALTSDHSPGREDERLRIGRAGSWTSDSSGTMRVEGSLAVSRAFGDGEYKARGSRESAVIATPEVMQILWAKQNFLMLSCDGVTEGNLTTINAARLAAEELARTGDAAAGARAVCKAAFAAGSLDNITCMVIMASEYVKDDLPPEELEQAQPRMLTDSSYRSAVAAFLQRVSPSAVFSSSVGCAQEGYAGDLLPCSSRPSNSFFCG